MSQTDSKQCLFRPGAAGKPAGRGARRVEPGGLQATILDNARVSILADRYESPRIQSGVTGKKPKAVIPVLKLHCYWRALPPGCISFHSPGFAKVACNERRLSIRQKRR
ncbi:hypothetical protein EMIT0P253_70157 [Pseudomonas sp. IT-P253]